jgi:hypothetical protein
MRKVVFLIFVLTVAAVLVGVNSVSATRPPTSPGQPNQNCEALPPQYEPHGFTTDGFANAANNYAGSGPGSAHANSDKAVSQYDVACFQQFSNGIIHLKP